MSTRSRIAIKSDLGIVSIYCHSDGYPEAPGVGATLRKFWTDPKKIASLIKLGSISELGEVIGKKHPFERPMDKMVERGGKYVFVDAGRKAYDKAYGKMTRAYRRDRGDSAGTEPIVSRTLSDLSNLVRHSDIVWVYLFDAAKAGQANPWQFAEVDGRSLKFKPLTAAATSVG